MEFEQNEPNSRTEEWFLIIGNWFRSTPRMWLYAGIGIVVGAIPLYMTLNLLFEQIFIRSAPKVEIIYQAVQKRPLEILEEKIISYGDGMYSGYAKIRNPNSEWGVASQSYQGEFKSNGGTVIQTFVDKTYILPFSEKILIFPRFSAPNQPSTLVIKLSESQFVRPPNLPALNLEIQRKTLDLQVNQSTVSAVIVNRTPYNITQVDLPVLLYDNANNVVAVNYTNINDLLTLEARSFQYNWYTRLNNVARQEIIPEVNIFSKDIFLNVPDSNPFNDIE